MDKAPSPISLLLAGMQKGDPEATRKIVPMVYDELRRLAARYMQLEIPGQTLQPTALVHEAFLKMIEGQSIAWESRAHFFGVASRLMREILIDRARKHNAVKHGGGKRPLQLDEALVYADERADQIVALDEALKRLEQLDPRQSRIIELRFFGGLSVEESAEVMGISPRTVKREWSVARLWLHRELSKES
jgi:RNA polymerase sigma factor (TIGR02999 family)